MADLDADGKLEILVTDSDGNLQALDASGRLTLEITATTYRAGVPAVGDVNGDGKPEIIFGTEAGQVYCLTPRANSFGPPRSTVALGALCH